MGKAKRKGRKASATVDRFIRPTPEREAHNDTRSAGAAVQFVPVIVALHKRELISDSQFAALAYYRDQAGLADRSPVKSCIDFSVKGGNGPGIAIQSAIRETRRIELDLGGLRSMTRQICVDDVSLEKLSAGRIGDFKLRRLSPLLAKEAIERESAMVVLELRFAAGRIVR